MLQSLEVVACGTTEVCVCDKAHKGGVGAAGVVLPNKAETTAEHVNLDPNYQPWHSVHLNRNGCRSPV